MSAVPQIGTTGVFSLIAPFTISTVDYTVTSITVISTLIELGINVFNTYYSPNNLSNNIYQTDLANNVTIVTLESPDGPTVSVPSSYISGMPVEQAVPYSRLVVSLDLGLLPDILNLSNLLSDLQTIANNYVGVNSTPALHKIYTGTSYSQSEYTTLEAQRLLNVQKYISFYTAKLDADAQLANARTQITMLEQALIAANRLIHTT